MDLNEVVNIAKNPEYDSSNVKSRRVSPDKLVEYVNPSNIDRIDEMVFGKGSSSENKDELYDATKDYERLKEGINRDNINKSKLPDFIKESMMTNPLIMDVADPAMDDLTERLSHKLSGIQKSMGILDKLDNMDKKANDNRLYEAKTNETKSGNAGIDYSIIRMIVENAVEEKLKAFRPMLSESVNRNTPSLNVMKLGESFLFLDDQNNVYECKMTYKGKNKKKKS